MKKSHLLGAVCTCLTLLSFNANASVLRTLNSVDYEWLELTATAGLIGLPAPIAIQHASPDELVFEVNRSKVLKGCKDNIVTLKRVNETTLQGELDDGRKLTLVGK